MLHNIRPFLKWAGGKQQLIPQLEELFPHSFERYFEPFVGAAAVFFHLWHTGRSSEQVFLSDDNEELINTYQVVRSKVEKLIDVLAIHQKRHNKEYYYEVRALDRQDVQLSDIERAARTIYLNKTCYNGLYRVNSRGQFNVPIGSYKNPQILNEGILRAASIALQHSSIEARDFREIVTLARPGDFLYFDPPYDPLSKTASFTSYTAVDFRDDDQRDLADVFRQLTKKGCLCMLSNSATPFVLDLYRGFRVETVWARRAVNSQGDGRGAVQEVVVLNYPA
jgi:DNA adenine methylase